MRVSIITVVYNVRGWIKIEWSKESVIISESNSTLDINKYKPLFNSTMYNEIQETR